MTPEEYRSTIRANAGLNYALANQAVDGIESLKRQVDEWRADCAAIEEDRDKLVVENAQLQRQVAELKRDAERYRHVLDNYELIAFYKGDVTYRVTIESGLPEVPKSMTAAIDAARAVTVDHTRHGRQERS